MRRKHRRLVSNPELDITPFLNLRMIELDFPGMESGEAPQADELRLVVALIPQGLEVLDSERGVIRTLPLIEGEQDFDGLRETLKQIKKRVPEKTDIVLEVSPDIDYQTLVTAMDTLRSYPAVVAASVVKGELFPDVALADAPENRTLSVEGEGA